MAEYARITSHAGAPPLWSFGYREGECMGTQMAWNDRRKTLSLQVARRRREQLRYS